MKRVIYPLLLLLFFNQSLKAQELRGRIFDATNSEGLPGAVVININDSTSAVTDEKGKFQLLVNQLPANLKISYLGYKPKEVILQEFKDYLNIGLNASDHHLNEVVVSATQINQKIIDIPAAVHAITQEELQRNDETTILPVINRMPGIFMESGSLNTNRIAIRGIGSRTPYGTNRIRAYFNDIPLTTGEGESTIEDIDISALQRVEIIKGPSSSIYGAGLGGTINLISSAPEFRQTRMFAKKLFGSFGLRNTQVALEHNTGNGFLNINLNEIHSDGYRENSEYNRQSITLSSSMYGSEDLSVSFFGSFIKLKAFIPSSINQNTYEESPQSAARNWADAKGYEAYLKSFAGISTRYSFGEKLINYSSAFISFRDGYEPRPFDILDENSVASGLRTRFEYNSGSVIFQLGAELFGDWYNWSLYKNLYKDFINVGSVSGSIISDNSEKRTYYNIFSQAQWEINKKLTIEGGLNYNVTDYVLDDLFYDNINQSGSYLFDPVLSPRLAALYRIRNGWNIFASVSHGFSNPSLAETLTPEGLINTDIKPETGTNYELGTKGRWLDNRLYGEISIYRADIKNLLVAERIGQDQYVGLNAGRTTHDGVEMMINYFVEINKSWTVEPFMSLTATNYRFRDFINRQEDFSGNRISGFPEKLINFGFDLKSTWGAYLYGDYRWVGEAALNDTNSQYNEAYSLLNLKVGFELKLDDYWLLDLNAGANNLLDEKYASMILVNAVAFGNNAPRYFYPGLPRNYYLGIHLAYLFNS